MTRYNGWKNYETWNVALWAANDEALYLAVQAQKPYDADKAAKVAFELFPHGTPDMDGDASRMVKVDWQAIADAWND